MGRFIFIKTETLRSTGMRTHSRSRLNFLTPPQISDHKKLPTLGSNEREQLKVINKTDKWDQVKEGFGDRGF